jgi:N-terminal region of glycosyl transferase group 7/N-terminal domain of galactosyltransferase
MNQTGSNVTISFAEISTTGNNSIVTKNKQCILLKTINSSGKSISNAQSIQLLEDETEKESPYLSFFPSLTFDFWASLKSAPYGLTTDSYVPDPLFLFELNRIATHIIENKPYSSLKFLLQLIDGVLFATVLSQSHVNWKYIHISNIDLLSIKRTWGEFRMLFLLPTDLLQINSSNQPSSNIATDKLLLNDSFYLKTDTFKPILDLSGITSSLSSTCTVILYKLMSILKTITSKTKSTSEIQIQVNSSTSEVVIIQLPLSDGVSNVSTNLIDPIAIRSSKIIMSPATPGVPSHPPPAVPSLTGNKRARESISPVKLAIIVPFRDNPIQNRMLHLEKFLTHMTAYLQSLPLEKYHIFIIEQATDGYKFNRGKLLNVGFRIASERGFNAFCFHDVDLIPKDGLKEYYSMPPFDRPIHIAATWTRYSYSHYIGGVLTLSSAHFQACNGYPNNFWGWGGEDDEFSFRMDVNNIPKPVTPSQQDLLIDLEEQFLKTHGGSRAGMSKKEGGDDLVRNLIKRELLQECKTNWRSNGLSSLQFTLLPETMKKGQIPTSVSRENIPHISILPVDLFPTSDKYAQPQDQFDPYAFAEKLFGKIDDKYAFTRPM